MKKKNYQGLKFLSNTQGFFCSKNLDWKCRLVCKKPIKELSAKKICDKLHLPLKDRSFSTEYIDPFQSPEAHSAVLNMSVCKFLPTNIALELRGKRQAIFV